MCEHFIIDSVVSRAFDSIRMLKVCVLFFHMAQLLVFSFIVRCCVSVCEIEYAVDVKLAHDHSISFLSTKRVFHSMGFFDGVDNTSMRVVPQKKNTQTHTHTIQALASPFYYHFTEYFVEFFYKTPLR